MDYNFDDDDIFGDSEKETPKKKKGGLIFLIVVAAIAVLALVYIFLNRKAIFKKPHLNIQSAPTQKSPAKNSNGVNIKLKDFSFNKNSIISGKFIAKLHINGVIQEENQTYNQKWLLETIEELKNDSNNLGILLVIDSPGGTVYEADEAYLALEGYKESGKMVWAYFESLAASGGYYIGCAGDTIYANRNTLTGSIGVIAGTSIDATEFLSKHGIKSTTFTAGKNKNMLNFNSPLTEEHKKIMQSIADDAYEQFTGIVAHARKKSIAQIKTLADGRIYTARQAMKNGLIDAIDTLENTQEKMKESVASTENFNLEDRESINFFDYKYEYQRPLFNRFMGMMWGQKDPATSLVDPVTKAALETLSPNIKYPAYLYRQ